MEQPLPFELAPRASGSWRGRWTDEKLSVVVAGTHEAPDPALVATLRGIVERWVDVRRAIATYAAGLPPGTHIPLEPASLGGFAARSCGFDEELTFETISLTDPSAPDRVEATFYTGYPDGYATYRAVLVAGEPTALTAFAS